MAEPPQIPVPALIRLESFQFNPNAFPTKYPPPKQVKRVKHITTRDILPTSKIVPMLRDAPNKIIANFSIFLDVNFSPVLISLVGFQK